MGNDEDKIAEDKEIEIALTEEKKKKEAEKKKQEEKSIENKTE